MTAGRMWISASVRAAIFKMPRPINVAAIDLFCGIGGLTCGLRMAGAAVRKRTGINLSVKAGFDIDSSCQFAYEENNDAEFVCQNIKETRGEDLIKYYKNADYRVLVGCAPCQPFSQLAANRKQNSVSVHDAEKWGVLRQFAMLIREVKPDIVSMENVPGLRRQKIYSDFLRTLEECGYHSPWHNIVECSDYGVPQRRKRLVLLASMHGKIELLPAQNKPKKTVRDALLCVNAAGGDNAHIHYGLSEKNLARIKKSYPGKYREQWDKSLMVKCHEENDFPETYGRMEMDKIAPTITTQFCFYSCGRFGHPNRKQNRAITIREGALLQAFPKSYRLIPKDAAHPDIRLLAQHIGNAVPPQLGKVIGRSIVFHIQNIRR